MSIKVEKVENPQEKKSYRKESVKKIISEVNQVLNIDVGFEATVETENIPNWKTNFYRERKKLYPEREFSFRKFEDKKIKIFRKC